MPRKFRKSKRIDVRGAEEWQRVLLAFGPVGVIKMHPANVLDLLSTHDEQWREWWSAYRKEILARWREMFRGTMPWGWWEFEAPRWDDNRFSSWSLRLPAPRLKIGGSGVYRHDRQAYLPVHASGCYVLIDVIPAYPPIFESEAAYMARHGLT